MFIMLFVFLLFLFFFPYIGEKQAKSKIIDTLRKQYEQEFEEEYQRLKYEYKLKLSEYEKDCIEYDRSLPAYLEHVKEYQQSVAEYDKAYEEILVEYEKAINQYNKIRQKYVLAYDDAYEKEETKLLKQGLSFNVSIDCYEIQNDSVGNDWHKQFYINGKQCVRKETITIKFGKKLTIKSVIKEEDSVVDVGKASSTFTLKKIDFRKGFEIEQKVTVRENRGRFAGNKAVFKVIFTFTPSKYDVEVDPSSIPPAPKQPIKPQYSPPRDTYIVPVKPEEPSIPLKNDVSITEPDYDSIVVKFGDILKYDPFIKVTYYLFSSFFTLSLFFMGGILIKGKIDIRKAEKDAFVQSLRSNYESINIQFQNRTVPNKVFTSKLERELNKRFWAFTEVEDKLNYELAKKELLQNKINHEYLQYDKEARSNLEEDIIKTDERIEFYKKSIDSQPDPLIDFPPFESNSTLAKAFKSTFRKPSSLNGFDSVLRFFAKSKLGYLLKNREDLFLFSGSFIIKARKNTNYIDTVPYDYLEYSLNESTAQMDDVPSSNDYDIIGVRWKHQTKTGERDKRYNENYQSAIVYQGKLKMKLGYELSHIMINKKEDAHRLMRALQLDKKERIEKYQDK